MDAAASVRAPLTGVRVLEVGGIGPVPFCGMVLADLGADVSRLRRLDEPQNSGSDPLLRSRISDEAIDLKSDSGRLVVIERSADSDVLIEGFRPGAMERLGLGPEVLCTANPQLVYGRMTGYGQEGPSAGRAGHDINFLAQAGTLSMLATPGRPPTPPLNLLADFGGGGMLLSVGVLSAVIAARESGRGCVVDAAMVDGSALLATMLHGFRAAGEWSDEPGTNLLDGAAPFYRAYECADGRHIAVGAIEPRFYEALLVGLGLDAGLLAEQHDCETWPRTTELIAARFSDRARDEWVAVFASLDACVSPVLSPDEAPNDTHNRARGLFFEKAGVTQPAPAPRFTSVEGLEGS